MPIQYSVVIPAYNAAKTIAEAIQSVLTQTIRPAEIIVVDDGSTDDTAAIVSAIPARIRLIRRANGGPGAATTDGIQAVSTPMLATLDSDDLWLPRKIEKQAAYLATNPEISVVFTLARQFQGDVPTTSDGRVQHLWSRTTMFIDTAAAAAVGAIIDPPGGRGDMVDWLARCGEMGYRSAIIEEVLALRRIRPDSLSFGRDIKRDVGYLHVARLAIERRRQRAA